MRQNLCLYSGLTPKVLEGPWIRLRPERHLRQPYQERDFHKWAQLSLRQSLRHIQICPVTRYYQKLGPYGQRSDRGGRLSKNEKGIREIVSPKG